MPQNSHPFGLSGAVSSSSRLDQAELTGSTTSPRRFVCAADSFKKIRVSQSVCFASSSSSSSYYRVKSIQPSLITKPLFSLCRFKSDEERTPVYGVVQHTFPLLLTIFNALVQIANPSVEVADLITLICKIFWSSIYVSLFSLPLSSINGKKNER